MVTGEPFFRMKEIPGEPKNSETFIDIIKNVGNITMYRLIPKTGKKHQIRVHLAALGIPIMNDKLYPVVKPFTTEDFSNPLQLLARSISFQDPLTNQDRCFESNRYLSWHPLQNRGSRQESNSNQKLMLLPQESPKHS
jgi:tRNA pseudouridine32 synthase/23S rRNA pseudouridine746 synthase